MLGGGIFYTNVKFWRKINPRFVAKPLEASCEATSSMKYNIYDNNVDLVYYIRIKKSVFNDYNMNGSQDIIYY